MNPARKKVWYENYEELLAEVATLKQRFQERCAELGHEAEVILAAFRRELLARAVHESNWQEGVELDYGRTRELADLMTDDLHFTDGTRLDVEGIVAAHKAHILRMKREKPRSEEIAAVNLARAHMMLGWIHQELVLRQTASLVRALRDAEGPLRSEAGKSGKPLSSVIEKGFETVRALMADEHPAGRPIQAPIGTMGEWLSLVVDTDFQSLLSPMDVKYVHGLHRITMMGVLPANQIGRWRERNVHVGNPDIDFPPPETVDSLMAEFCRVFPTILPLTVKYEPMLVAAKTSYRFVRIHPYVDGNGRMSRLIMNLILQGHHPMVSLAPRAKERHRYRQAIRRADRGKIEPLAALVAISVRDTYQRMLQALMACPDS